MSGLFPQSFDTHVEQILNEIVCSLCLQFLNLCGYHILLYILKRLGILAEFVDICGIMAGGSAIGILLKEFFVSIKLTEP